MDETTTNEMPEIDWTTGSARIETEHAALAEPLRLLIVEHRLLREKDVRTTRDFMLAKGVPFFPELELPEGIDPRRFTDEERDGFETLGGGMILPGGIVVTIVNHTVVGQTESWTGGWLRYYLAPWVAQELATRGIDMPDWLITIMDEIEAEEAAQQGGDNEKEAES